MHSSTCRLMVLFVLIGAITLNQALSAIAQTTATPSATTTATSTSTTTPATVANQTGTLTATLTTTPTLTTPTPTVTATSTVLTVQRTDDPTAVPLDPPLAFLVVLTLLILAIFVLSRLFTYLTDSREDYYGTVREFARKGVFSTPVLISPIAGTAGVGTAEEAAPTTTFEVAGPGALAPGQPGVFTALKNGSPATAVTWELRTTNGDQVPSDTASLEVAAGSGSATVTAAKSGVLVLVASLAETPVLTVRTVLTVVEPPIAADQLLSLPFIGQGFGSIISAIVLIAALVVLATTRAIDADVVGVVLGALAGYLFGVGIGNRT